MRSIQQTYIVAATPEEVWAALTEPDLIEEWSGADVEFEPEVGFPYSLWDGDIGGEILEVVPRQKLVQSWKPEDWTIEDSVVTFTLTPVEDGTRVDLLHENVEDFDFDGTTEGWDLYYLGAIKRMFEPNAKPRNTKLTKATKTAKKTTTKNAKVAKKGKAVAKRKITAKKTSKKK